MERGEGRGERGEGRSREERSLTLKISFRQVEFGIEVNDGLLQ